MTMQLNQRANENSPVATARPTRRGQRHIARAVAIVCALMVVSVAATASFVLDARSSGDESAARGGSQVVFGGQLMGLSAVEAFVRTRYASVEHINPEDLSDLVSGRSPDDRAKPPLLLDIRQAGEFGVSHLEGAVRIDPNADVDDILREVGDISNRTVVVYCSVGVRSSKLAHRLKTQLNANAPARVVNLSGGIFRWHNERRSLWRGDQRTNAVHPFNSRWGKLITRRDEIQFTPKPR